MPSIKKNDEVSVCAERTAGQDRPVLIVLPKDQKIVVEGVQSDQASHASKPAAQIKGGIVEKEAPIHVSNVAIVCKNCKQHTRQANQILSDGRRARACKKCGNIIE
jgi:large subunit ribosomal protein L24